MLLVRVIAMFFALALTCHPAYAQKLHEISVVVEGTQRRAVVVNDLGPDRNTPVVIVLHGGQGSAERIRSQGLAVGP